MVKYVFVSLMENGIGGGVSHLMKLEKNYLKQNEKKVSTISIFKNASITSVSNQETDVVISDRKYVHVNKLTDIKKMINLFSLIIPIFNRKTKKKFNDSISSNSIVTCTDPYVINYIKRRDDIEVIFEIHTSITQNKNYRLLLKLILFLNKKKIDKVIYLDAVDEKFLNKYEFTSIRVRNYIIDEYNYNKELRNDKLVYFGLIQKVKAIDEMIKYSNDNNIKIDFYGKIIDYSIEELEKLNVNKMCNFYTKAYDLSEMKDIFSNYSGYIMASKFEGQPLTVIEAIDLGLPIICPTSLTPVVSMVDKLHIDWMNFEEINKVINNSEFRNERVKQLKKIDFSIQEHMELKYSDLK